MYAGSARHKVNLDISKSIEINQILVMSPDLREKNDSK